MPGSVYRFLEIGFEPPSSFLAHFPGQNTWRRSCLTTRLARCTCFQNLFKSLLSASLEDRNAHPSHQTAALSSPLTTNNHLSLTHFFGASFCTELTFDSALDAPCACALTFGDLPGLPCPIYLPYSSVKIVEDRKVATGCGVVN